MAIKVLADLDINSSALLTSWDSSNTDIDGLIDGSTFGGLLQSPSSGHFVLGLKDNDSSDSFAVMSGSGNYTTDSTYDKLCFRVKTDGSVLVPNGNIIMGSQYGIRFNDANTRIYTNSDSPEDLLIEADQDCIINPDGNVGIGTTTPSEKLHIYHATTNTLAYLQSGDADTILAMADNGGSIEIKNTSGNLIFETGGNANTAGSSTSEVMRITSSNVGIGTTTPQKKLDVYLGTNSAVASIAGGISSGEYAGLHFGYSETGNSNYRHSAIVFERDDTGHGDARGNIHILNSASGSSSADLGDSRLTIVPSGNVGIGTTAPQSPLSVKSDSVSSAESGFTLIANGSTDVVAAIGEKSTNGGRFHLYDGGAAKVSLYSDGTANYIAAGNVGIGTTNPEGRLHVYNGDAGSTTANVSHDDLIIENNGNVGVQLFGPATSYQYIAFGDTGSANAGYVRYDHNLNEMRLRVNGSDKFTIASDGDVGIGTTSPSEKLHVDGNILASGDVTAFSDQRLKEDIKPLQDSLEKVQAIEGVSFVQKNDEHKKQKIGFIAQQLKEILPEVVHENDDGIHSVAYGNITALLVEAVKEQQEIISQLEERIVELENR